MSSQHIKTGISMAIALLAFGCSPKIYHPPALGAEYQFDRGLPPAKKPSHLFDKKMEKDLAEKGTFQSRKTSSGNKEIHSDSTRAARISSSDSTKSTTIAPVRN